MKKKISLILVFTITGCSHTWVGKPAYMFESEKAQCSYIARHGGGGFYAQGSQSYVAGAQLGYAIGEIARTREDFDDCMLAKGWRIADNSTSSSTEYIPRPVVKPSPATESASVITTEKSTISTTTKETVTKVSESNVPQLPLPTAPLIDNLEEMENKCKELGFKPKSPKFGKCVLGLSK